MIKPSAIVGASIGVFLILPFIVAIFSVVAEAASILVINEVAYKGSADNRCDGEDWIELLYLAEDGNDEDQADAVVVTTSTALDLTNYVLHDDNGKDDEDAKIFSGGEAEASSSINSSINLGEYLVLCKGVDFEFGIGSDDTITLLDNTGAVVSTVALPGTGADDETYAYVVADDNIDGTTTGGGYKYTTTPTSGAANVHTAPMPLEEKLKAQNDAGNDFFLVDDTDASEEEVFSKVVDIHVIVDDDSLAIINDHPAWEEWVPFTELAVSNIIESGNNSSDTVSSGGKIRTKGQSTLSLTSCLGQSNVPFQIEFDAPFLGMETVYLRNHLGDQSYMRDYASHVMLQKFGLPYLRTRPVRLYLNGEYIGFYTMMEAPTQGYVMQRSFGAFDPTQTALFKAKTMMADCPFTDTTELENAAKRDVPDPYYFERGDHRDDTPVLEGEIDQCYGFFVGELMKEHDDVVKGYLEYNQTCGLAMTELGRVDRDYGPKSIEEKMVSFLDSKFYNASVDDLTDSVDADQWIKNFAAYAVTLNIDSPVTSINTWYLATTSGGNDNDWRIVQYDHNNIASRAGASLCEVTCGPRMIYWPILRPTCSAVEDHPLVGRILNDKERMQTYLDYVQEFVDMILSDDLLGNLRSYGNVIKEFIVDDPYSRQTIEEYEEYELGTNIDDYNTESSPFLKTMEARVAQVQAQLDAINEGSLPRDGVYDKIEACPDWRDSSGDDYMAGSTVGESCAFEECKQAGPCYENNNFVCSPEGDLVVEECKFASPFCDSCFPYSRCGTGSDDNSGVFVESDDCGAALADCATATSCFDHKSGMCAYDGEILTVECGAALPFCKPCFPNSRCGGLVLNGIPDEDPEETPDDESGIFVESDKCGLELAGCATATSCFDHNSGICADDGEITLSECQVALPFCVPCFPNSRCGGLASDETPDEALEEALEGTNPEDNPVPTVTPAESPSSTTSDAYLNIALSRTTVVLIAAFSWFLSA